MTNYLPKLLLAASLLCPALVLANTAATPSQPATTTTTSADQKTADIQLKTADGGIIPAKVNPEDIKNVKSGDKVELLFMRSLK